jgi:hypothetical protein
MQLQIKNTELTAKARDEQRLKAENVRKPKQKKIRKKRRIARTVQKSLPYQKIVDD